MADLLETAETWLAGQLKSSVGKSIVYRRGDNTVPLTATVGSSVFEQRDDTDTVINQWEGRDFLILPADLVLDGSTVTPERGDQIVETVGGESLTYEVMSPGDEPVFRYTGPHRKQLRIHTKQVGT